MTGFDGMGENMVRSLDAAEQPTIRLKSFYQLAAFHVVCNTHLTELGQCSVKIVIPRQAWSSSTAAPFQQRPSGSALEGNNHSRDLLFRQGLRRRLAVFGQSSYSKRLAMKPRILSL
ncbi:hypothetical protein [Desulfobulbus propionicus]|jgi:hypothetical protein